MPDKEVAKEDLQLAFQIWKHRLERGRYKDLHWRQLRALEHKEGFTGTLSLGKGERSMYRLTTDKVIMFDTKEDSDDEDDGAGHDSDIGEELETILTVTLATT